tara:strand:- start:115 stop:498 length:384 start_codon:yes stop_codon:yes gene_type:complete
MKIMSLLSLVIKNNLVEGASAHWWSQRVSAFFLVILFLWLTFSLGNIENYEYDAVILWSSGVLNSTMLVLLSVAMIYHSSLGLEVIIEDYIHTRKTRKYFLTLNKVIHLLMAGVMIVSIFFINMGSQ